MQYKMSYFSPIIEIPTDFQQLFAFFPNHQHARTYYQNAFDQLSQIVIYEGRQVIGLYLFHLDGETLFLDLALIQPNYFMQKNLLMRDFLFFTRPLRFHQVRLELDVHVRDQCLRGLGFVMKNEGDKSRYVLEQLPTLGLAFGGGGSRGGYQIGVWQALVDLHMVFKVVTGTSVGALNGTLAVQGSLQDGIELWEQMSTSDVMTLDSDQFINDQQLVRVLFANTISQNGVAVAPLRHSLERLWKRDTFPGRQHPRFGIVTTQLPNFKKIQKEITDFSDPQFIDWLLASSAFFPVMKPVEIDGASYIDGGYNDNLPIQFAKELGGEQIVAIDVKGPGRNAGYDPSGISVCLVESNWSLGSFLGFDQQRSRRNLQLGYLETFKAFGMLSGSWYSFSKLDVQEVQVHQARLETFAQQKLATWLPGNWAEFLQQVRQKLSIFQNKDSLDLPLFIVLLEEVAQRFEVDPTHVYRVTELKAALTKQIVAQAPTSLSFLSFGELFYNFNEQWRFLSRKESLLAMAKLVQHPEKIDDAQKRVLRLIAANFTGIFMLSLLIAELLPEFEEE